MGSLFSSSEPEPEESKEPPTLWEILASASDKNRFINNLIRLFLSVLPDILVVLDKIEIGPAILAELVAKGEIPEDVKVAGVEFEIERIFIRRLKNIKVQLELKDDDTDWADSATDLLNGKVSAPLKGAIDTGKLFIQIFLKSDRFDLRLDIYTQAQIDLDARFTLQFRHTIGSWSESTATTCVDIQPGLGMKTFNLTNSRVQIKYLNITGVLDKEPETCVYPHRKVLGTCKEPDLDIALPNLVKGICQRQHKRKCIKPRFGGAVSLWDWYPECKENFERQGISGICAWQGGCAKGYKYDKKLLTCMPKEGLAQRIAVDEALKVIEREQRNSRFWSLLQGLANAVMVTVAPRVVQLAMTDILEDVLSKLKTEMDFGSHKLKIEFIHCRDF